MLVCLMRFKNNERTLARTLDAMPFVDKFILVNNGSEDSSPDIAAQYPSIVLPTEGLQADRDMNVAYKKALEIGADWALHMDADEEWEARAETDFIKLTQQDLVTGWTFRKMCFVVYKDFYRVDGNWAAFCEPHMQFAWPLLLFQCQPQAYFEEPRQIEPGCIKNFHGAIRASDLRVKHWTIDSEEEIERKIAFLRVHRPDNDYSHLRNDERAMFRRWIE